MVLDQVTVAESTKKYYRVPQSTNEYQEVPKRNTNYEKWPMISVDQAQQMVLDQVRLPKYQKVPVQESPKSGRWSVLTRLKRWFWIRSHYQSTKKYYRAPQSTKEYQQVANDQCWQGAKDGSGPGHIAKENHKVPKSITKYQRVPVQESPKNGLWSVSTRLKRWLVLTRVKRWFWIRWQ